MNSGRRLHALQGRDRHGNAPAHVCRSEQGPCQGLFGGAYYDCLYCDLVAVHQGMALSMAQLSPEVEIISEVENWPIRDLRRA